MAVMQPFELVFELGSNISLRESPIHLDGLLSNVCFRHTGCTERALSMLDELLLINHDFGIYHASAMAFGVTPEQSIVARSRHYVGAMRPGKELRDDIILPTQPARNNKEQYRKITVAGGPEKLRLNKYSAYYSPYLVFHGVGDVYRIERLIQFHCHRIGVNANSGGGTISNVMMKSIDHDFSFIDAHGQIARNLPVSLLETVLQTNPVSPNFPAMEDCEPLPVRPPYWKPHHRYSITDAVAAEKIRRVVI